MSDLSEILYFILLLGGDYHDVVNIMENYNTVNALSCFYKVSNVGLMLCFQYQRLFTCFQIWTGFNGQVTFE